MKILMLVDNYPPEMNANARIFAELSEAITKLGLDVTVMTSHPNFPRGILFDGHENKWRTKTLENDVQVVRVKTYMHPNKGVFRRTLDFISFGLSSFFFGLFEKGNDIIVGVTPQFFCAFSACLLSIIKRKPFLLVLCDLWPDSILANKMMSRGFIFNVIKKLEFFMYKKAQTIAILSPYFRNYLTQAKVDNSKIIDFISGPNESFFPRKKDQNLMNQYQLQNKIVIGYIGTFGISHNHEEIIEVLKSLSRDDVHLFMIGEGAKKEELSKLIKTYNLGNVTIGGPIDAVEVANHWSVCDVAIIPLEQTETNKTVIPSKILEAMRVGLPTILYTPIGEVTRFFSESQAIWHIESGDINSLKDFMEKLSHNMIAEKKEQAITFSMKFSRENQAKQLFNAVQTICKREKNYEAI